MATEDKIKLVFKGILLYITIIVSFLFVGGVDSLYDNGYFTLSVVIVAALIYACYKTISKEDADTLLLTKYFGGEESDDEW